MEFKIGGIYKNTSYLSVNYYCKYLEDCGEEIRIAFCFDDKIKSPLILTHTMNKKNLVDLYGLVEVSKEEIILFVPKELLEYKIA